MSIVVEKPWGQEAILETNEHYTVKRITMNVGHRCSMQKHLEKRETVVALSGVMDLILDGANYRLNPGDFITINPGDIHQMRANTDTIVYLECSTSQLNDVVRLVDNYGRA